MCWRLLSVCWTGARRSPPPLGASGSEEGLVRIRVSTAKPGAQFNNIQWFLLHAMWLQGPVPVLSPYAMKVLYIVIKPRLGPKRV